MTAAAPDPAGGNQNRLRGVTTRVVSILLFGLATGVIGSMLAVLFVESIRFLDHYLLGSDRHRGFNLWWLLTPVAGGLVVGLLLHRTQQQRPENIADLINAVQIGEKQFRWRDGLINALAAIVGMGSGASVGHYGPLATLGAHLGNLLMKVTRADFKLAAGCGVAAMISTAFSAPIAGVIFVHEVVLRHYALRNFAPITIASSTGFYISAYLLGRPPLFEVAAERSLFAPEFLAFVLIGIVGALIATVFMTLLLWTVRFAETVAVPQWLKPAIAGLGVGLLAQWVPDVLGAGQQILDLEITGAQMSLDQLMWLLPAKMLATALCIGFGFAGGAFSPSLVIGVLSGAIIGVGAESLLGDYSSGITFYAICGMVAVTSPVIGGPLTAIMIVFELTRNYELTTAVMISVAFSNVVAYRLFGRSLFDRQLLQRGLDLSLGRDKAVLQRTLITHHVSTDAITVNGAEALAAARSAMLQSRHQECTVLDDQDKFLGKLRIADILAAQSADDLSRRTCAQQANSRVLTLEQDLSVWDALQKLQDFSGESVPVIDQHGVYTGVIYHSTLIAAYLKMSANLRAEEHAAG